MHRNKVVFCPYKNYETSYIYMMQSIISDKYEVLDYDVVKKSHMPLDNVKCIYLNWIENSLSEEDKILFERAKCSGVQIIWVFHNRVPHDMPKTAELIDDMKYMISISDHIILHSKSSQRFIEEYDGVGAKKTVFIPHVNFIDCYGRYGKVENLFDEDEFVFAAYGLIRPYKNLEILIDAFNRLPDSFEKATLLIAGKAFSEEYIDKLRGRVGNGKKVLFMEGYIASLEMGTLLDMADIMVFPYDTQSGMNSGALIMGASYRKTAIISNIAMADDFENADIYKYDYSDEENHVQRLAEKMKEAYLAGKQNVHAKGERLYQKMMHENNAEVVRSMLYELLEGID